MAVQAVAVLFEFCGSKTEIKLNLHDEPLSVLEQAMRSFRSSVVLQTMNE